MELFFRKYFRWLHHKSHTLRRKVFHNQTIKEFFASKNARLAVILIIAAAIPLTVLAVQQIQDIRQQAAAPNMCNGGATGLLASPNPAEDGQTITFTHTGAFPPIDENSFQNDDFISSNGTSGCTRQGASIVCKAKYNEKSKDPISDHTWTFHGAECNFQVKKPAKSTKPKGSPTPTADPAGECKGTMVATCDGNNKPVLTISYDLRGGKDGSCKATIDPGNNNQGNNCTSRSGIRVTDLENDKSYNLVLNSGNANCTNKSVAKADTKCKATTPTPIFKPGGNTPTPGTGTPTNTPAPGQATCRIDTAPRLDINQSSCSGTNHKISGAWKISGPNCVIRLYKNGVEINKSTECDKKSGWSTHSGHDDIVPGEEYQLKATSDTCTEEKLSNTITAKACVPNPTQVPGSFGADDLGNPNATPTKVPFAPPIQP